MGFEMVFGCYLVAKNVTMIRTLQEPYIKKKTETSTYVAIHKMTYLNHFFITLTHTECTYRLGEKPFHSFTTHRGQKCF